MQEQFEAPQNLRNLHNSQLYLTSFTFVTFGNHVCIQKLWHFYRTVLLRGIFPFDAENSLSDDIIIEMSEKKKHKE